MQRGLVARAAGERRRGERRHPHLRLAAPEVARVAVGGDEHRQRVQRLAPGAQHGGRGRRTELRDRLAEHERGERVVGERILGRVAEDGSADRAAVDQRADGVVDRLRDALVHDGRGRRARDGRVAEPRRRVGRGHAGAGDREHGERVDELEVGVAARPQQAAAPVGRDAVGPDQTICQGKKTIFKGCSKQV